MKKDIGIILRAVKTMYLTDKACLAFMLLATVLNTIKPFLELWLLREVVHAITDKVIFVDFIRIVLFYSALIFVVQALMNWVKSIYTVKKDKLRMSLQTSLTKKCMEINYEDIVSETILDKKAFAQQTFDNFNSIFDGIITIVSNISILAAATTIIGRVNIIIISVAFVGIALNALFSKLNKSKEYERNVKNASIYRKFNYFYDLFSNFEYAKEIRGYNMSKRFDPILDDLTAESYRLSTEYFSFSRLTQYILSLAYIALSISIYILLGYQVLVEKSISYADFVFLSGMIIQFSSSVSSITETFVEYKQCAKYINAFFDFIDMKCRYTESGLRQLPVITSYEIEFHNVSFKYPNQEVYALKNSNLKIKDGDILAIVGENGAGKTTLIKLLMGLYIPTEGVITLNGIDISKIDNSQYLTLFSTVFQDFKHFAFTVEDNITMLQDKNSVSEEKIKIILKNVGLDKKINMLANGLSTNLYRIFDEQGVEFSGGEQEKLAIARAMYKPSNILILDEPTSALDVKAESELYELIHKYTTQKIVLFISHRLASTRFCNKILVLQQGKIIQQGTHQELLQTEGLYRELHQMQSMYYQDNKESQMPHEEYKRVV